MWISTLIEVAIIWAAIFVFLRFLRGTHGKAIVTGLTWVFIIVMAIFAIFHKLEWLDSALPTLGFIADNLGIAFGLGVLILLQPELRFALLNLGPPWRRKTRRGGEEEQRYGEIALAASHLAERRRGALMALQRSVGLRTWAVTGIALECRVRSEILESIFEGSSSIHDGAVVIDGDRIVAAGCLLPLSEGSELASRLGTRHRAAIGLSERSDAVVVVVSEETGHIGLAVHGELDFGEIGNGLKESELRERLTSLMMGKEES